MPYGGGNYGYDTGGALHMSYPRPKPPRRYRASARGYAPGGVSYYPIRPASRVGPGGAPLPAGVGRGGGGVAAPAHKMTLWEQAQMLINRALNPQIAQINAAYDRQQKANAAAIAAATKGYVDLAGQYAPSMANAYAQAQGAQASSDTALANLLGGKGTQAAGELATALNAPPGSEAAASLSAIGRGAAATTYGMGSADLTRLISQGVNEQAYGRKLPGLAALTGLQDTKSMLAELGRARLDAIGEARATGSQETLNLWKQLRGEKIAATAAEADRQFKRRMAIESGLIDLKKAGLSSADKAAALQARIAHYKAQEANANLTREQRATLQAQRIQAQKDLAIYNKTHAQARSTTTDPHATAIKNRGNQKAKALNDVRRLQREAVIEETVPGQYGGTVTKKTKKPLPYAKVHSRAMALPNVQLLMTRFGYSRAQVSAMIDQQLAAYGIKPKSQTVAPKDRSR